MRELNLEDVEEQIQLQPRIVEKDAHQLRLAQTNAQQKELFDMVIGAVMSIQKQILLYVSGTAGVGKTSVIDLIADELRLLFGNDRDHSSPPVLLCAPTGLAALSIKGLTLHSLLMMQVNSNSKFEASYQSLRDDQRDLLRHLFANVRLIIIDEISMVSA